MVPVKPKLAAEWARFSAWAVCQSSVVKLSLTPVSVPSDASKAGSCSSVTVGVVETAVSGLPRK